MTDDNIKDLFAGFNPQIGSETDFLSRLQTSLAVIEEVRKEQAALRRCCRIAAVIASVAGFMTGLVLAFYMPEIAGFIGRLPLQSLTSASLPACDPTPIAWLLTAAASITVALTGYETAYRLLRPHLSVL